MKLSEILSKEEILVSMGAETLEEAVGLLFQRLEASGILDRGVGTRLAAEFFSEARGEVVRVNEWVVLVAAQTSQVEGLVGCLGTGRSSFELGDQGEGGTASVLLLLLTPRRVSPLKIQAIPALSRFFRDKDNASRLRDATAPEEITSFSELMDLDVQDQLLVADGLTPLVYRVYPDTPLSEVVGLMVRRGVRAVPVVGEKLEFLGLLTSSDAIRHLIPERLTGSPGGKEMGSLPAREVMTRSVMCISEDQSLVEAANLMVNKGVSQVPVVRAGELVGFLTVETALQLLFDPAVQRSGMASKGETSPDD
ncbi:MAG: CBS domain-containing protein [Gemmatimonadota bacterium]|jgi:CBS domain-containing protein